MHDSDSESDDDERDPKERFWEGWSEYQNIWGLKYIEHDEFEDVTYKRFLCYRWFYIVKLSHDPIKRHWERYINGIFHHKKDVWSTHWLDIIFNSKFGQRKDIMRHDVFIHDPLPIIQEFGQPRQAYPSYDFIGYYHFRGDWRTVYFLCPIARLYEPNVKRSYMIALTEKERKRLWKRTQINRRYSITKWLLDNWKSVI